jgi:alpha-glucosidase
VTTSTAASAPSSSSGTGAEWWRTAVIYQVYPRSFADSDGDGIGDLPGVTAHLDHLATLGVDAVWLSPFYTSPQADAGYDVADYTDVDPAFGTLADADALVARAHELGLRVVVDLVPNHTSDEHAWFQAALAAGPGSPERAVYLFRDGKGSRGELPPTDWHSVFGGPAWDRVTEADGSPGQWYLHLFDSKQPDLDWSNPVVRERLEGVLRFWLDRGVDGFRVDVAHGLAKDPELPDWSFPQQMLVHSETGARAPMWDRDDVHDIYRSWRQVLDSYDGDRVLVAEAWVEPAERLAAYVRPDEMHQAFNFEFLDTPWTSAAVRDVVDRTTAANAAVGAPTTWVLSNHDVVRHASRLGLPVGAPRPNGISADDPQPDAALGLARARAATLLMLALPGSAYLYQGEELGLPDHTTLPHDVRQDPAFHRTGGEETGRDGCRVPMPWSQDAPGLGFSPTGRTWLPQPESYRPLAADAQVGVPGSTFELYREALRLRSERHLAAGDGSGRVAWAQVAEERDDVLAFTPAGPGGDLLVVTVFGDEPLVLPAGAQVLLASAEVGHGEEGALVLPGNSTAWLRG